MGEFGHRVLIILDKPSNLVYPASLAAHIHSIHFWLLFVAI